MDPKMGPGRGHFLVIWFFFLCQAALGAQMAPKASPQEPPRPVQASISIDFGLILDDCLMILCIMWATFYLACLITFLVTSSFHFQISGHNVLRSSVGVSKVTKKVRCGPAFV